MSCIDRNYFKLEFKVYGLDIIKAYIEGYFINKPFNTQLIGIFRQDFVTGNYRESRFIVQKRNKAKLTFK